MPDIVKPTPVQVTIYYDGDCPFCSNYVRYLDLREAIGGNPLLVNVREHATAREELANCGLDLDKGMVAEISGTRFHGDNALHALALLTSRSGFFNRLTAWSFASPVIAKTIYPVLRAGRNATLLLIGRDAIRANDEGWQALFTVFSLVFGLFAFIHFFVYAFRFTAFQIYPSTWLILIFGTLLFLYPGSRRWFTLLIGAMALDAWLHAPMHSNHTILKNFLLLAIIAGGSWHLLKGSRWSDFFQDVVPVGRVLLLVMYFYGVFHKINEGFIDPSVSCAVALWQVLPWPIYLLDHPIIQYSAIYGTFIVETVIALMLIVPRTRGIGIVLGIGFHGFLGLSGFAMYPAFSTLTIAMHVLFLTPDQARRIAGGENFQALVRRMRSWLGIILLALGMALISVFAIMRDYNMVAIVWLTLAVPVFAALLFPGRGDSMDAPDAQTPAGPLLWSRIGWLNIIGVLFFLNCAMPYFGLKTAQAMNMFANLRLEGGVNNHLIMRSVPMPFAFLDDIVELRTAEGAPIEEVRTGAPQGMTYYHLLDHIDRFPDARISFVRDGTFFSDQSAETLAEEIAQHLHPRWFRKWFHFSGVLLQEPPPCR